MFEQMLDKLYRNVCMHVSMYVCIKDIIKFELHV